MASGAQRPTITIRAYADVTTDITADVFYDLDAESGITGNGAEDRTASTGIMTFDMDNAGVVGKYVPGHSACMAGWEKGVRIEIEFVYDTRTKNEIWYLNEYEVTGTLEERVSITCVDWMDKTAKHPVINPDLLTEATADEGIEALLAAFATPPDSTNLDTGTNVFLTLLDIVNRFTRAMTAMAHIIMSELGYIYLQHPETLRFENMTSRNGGRALSQIPVHSDSAGNLQDEDSNTITITGGAAIMVNAAEDTEISSADGHIISYENESGRNIINRASAVSHPRRTDENTIVVFQPERPIFIASGERRIWREFWSDPVTHRPINAIPTEDDFTKALLHFEGNPGHQVSFVDDTGRDWVAHDVEIVRDVFGTAPKFGEGCAYMDGSTSYITSADSPDFDLLDEDFTIDWWEYRFASTSGQTSVSRDGDSATPPYRLGRSNGTSLLVDITSDGVSFDIANGKTMGTITTGQFVHLCIMRSGDNFYTFKNGVLQDSWTSSGTVFASGTEFFIGKNQSANIDGCIDEFHFVKGAAIFSTAGFTPPTSAYELQGLYLFAWTAEDGTGTELTDDITVHSVDYGTEGATFDIENTATVNGWLFMTVYAQGIHLDSPSEYSTEDADSINTVGTYEKSLDLIYQQNDYLGSLEAKRVVDQEHLPRMVLHRVNMNANRTTADMMRFLYMGVGDLVHSEITTLEKDAWFWIQRRGYTIRENKNIDFWWLLREHYSLQKGLDDLAVEFAGTGGTDGVNFGFLPHVYSDYTPETLTFSFWFRPQTFATGSLRNVVWGLSTDNGGIRFEYHPDTDDNLRLYSNVFNTSPGIWELNSASSANTTYHILAEYDISSPTNNPVIYVNGSSAAFTEVNSPAGDKFEKKGTPVVLGNLKTASINYLWGFDGKIWDARIYHNIDTSRASLLYNGGTYNPLLGFDDYLRFQAFAIQSSRYSGYQDLTLTSTDRLLDAYLMCVGTPNGSPISRIP